MRCLSGRFAASQTALLLRQAYSLLSGSEIFPQTRYALNHILKPRKLGDNTNVDLMQISVYLTLVQ
jgi:hypothetical protein